MTQGSGLGGRGRAGGNVVGRIIPGGGRGFTLVELLVVIGVIAVLVAILLPAVLQSRGAARRSQCGNNLKQLAFAVQQFHNKMDALPVYWGSMKGRPGEMFGGWLAHILPELDQEPLYSALLATNTGSITTYSWQPSDIIDPAVPASPDYQPGTWRRVTENVPLASGGIIVVTRNILEGQVGSPGRPERRRWVWAPNTTSSGSFASGFGAVQSRVSLAVLQCGDDPSTTPPGAMINIVTGTGVTSTTTPWSLTNYMANSHVFTLLGNGRRIASGVNEAGLFWPPRLPGAAAAATAAAGTSFTHREAPIRGPGGRTFGHVVDGLSNTILFGECMRQCDGGNSFRFAFLPTGHATHEHCFGLEPSFTGTNSSTIIFNGSFGPSPTTGGGWPMGNTLRFQARPAPATCNHFRIQGNHGAILMTAMCDGSIRAISSSVDAREQVTAEASGRENFGTPFYSAQSRGGDLPASGSHDGIWDMLMVPADPPGNVLYNTGEVGKERRAY